LILITSTQRAVRDLRQGTLSPRLWILLAWNDLEAKYRRTILGTFWQTLTSAAYIVGLTVVFSSIRGHRGDEFVLYLAAGYTAFSLISGFVSSGANAFQRGASLLMAYDLPASIHVYRAVTNEFIMFAHSLVIMLGVWIYSETWPTVNTLLLFPALILMFALGCGVVMTFGLLGARFRDVSPAVATVTSFLFLVTPIFWRREDLGSRTWIVDLNPFYHATNLIRRPLMGEAPDPINWYVCIAMAIVSLILGTLGFIKYRRQLVYWL